MNAPTPMNYREKCEWLRNNAMQLAAMKGLTFDEFCRDELDFDPIASKGRDLKRSETVYLAHNAYADGCHVSGAIDMALRGIHERTAMRLLGDFVGRSRIRIVNGERQLQVDAMSDNERQLVAVIIKDLQRLLQRDDVQEMFSDGEQSSGLLDGGESERSADEVPELAERIDGDVGADSFGDHARD